MKKILYLFFILLICGCKSITSENDNSNSHSNNGVDTNAHCGIANMYIEDNNLYIIYECGASDVIYNISNYDK